MLLDLLKDLILIDSSNKDGANEAVEYCVEWLSKRGLEVKTIENNGHLMLVCEIGKGNKTIIFNGHVDVVSGKAEQFFPIERDGRLYGRGSADMKAGVAAMMCAMVQLKDKDLRVKIQLHIVSDEETGGFNCTGYLVKHGYLGDFAICSEPTQLGIGLQAKGVLRLEITVHGKPAHGSRPWEGINAIEKAWSVYENIKHLPFAEENSPFYSSPSINLAKIYGGDVFNKVPSKCVLTFDIRFLPTQDKDEIIKQIKSTTDGEVLVDMFSMPVNTQPDDPYITLLKSIIDKNSNIETRMFGQHGSADTVFYAAFGIPAIEFGPTGGNWHGDEEYVETESLIAYKNMLVDYCLEFTVSEVHQNT
ncbi:succinyl-diaminopimelate desuccinylase [Bacillus sp. M6-12]|uniref:M20 family metallopeptidase n=1 Tax=Bacillus sp. M6-12 TaxID=2054166 RepID=UPI000C7887BA|nr:M20/M25/M40 family metallo-hydrolase [Bacillus sp. M6-12]PLS15974.1 succinyl-diaminopimelate desuccinylase [Bacillus sp. M6-12]